MNMIKGKSKKFPVVELFGPTIQGEGAVAGQFSHFVRFGGCPRRCSWCDSMHAVLPEEVQKNALWLEAQDIAKGLEGLGPSPWVTFSGGDPMMWELDELISLLTCKFRIAVETQGDLWRDWVERVDLMTISPKPPSAQKGAGADDGPPNYEMIQRYLSLLHCRVALKVVVFDQDDLRFAVDMHERFPGVPFYLSSGTAPFDGGDAALKLGVCKAYQELCETVLTHYPHEMRNVTILPQLHVLCWGNKKGV